MKINFKSKSFMAKIALVLVIIILFQFSVPRPVQALSGGQLLSPIVNLVVFLADGVISILQSSLTNIEESFNYIKMKEKTSSFWRILKTIVAGIVLVVAGAAIITATSGAATGLVVHAVGSAVGGAIGLGGKALIGGGIAAGAVTLFFPQVAEKIDAIFFGDSFVYPNIYISPETILKNQIQLFNVNYFEKIEVPEDTQIIDNKQSVNSDSSDSESSGDDAQPSTIDNTQSLAATIRNVVSQVYSTIRDIALVAMLIVIIYIGIRMLLALSPKEKSRYKESIVNCVIGLILILVMHYIMSISVTLVEQITNSIAFSNVITDIGEAKDADEYLNANPEVRNRAISGISIAISGSELYDAVVNPDTENSSEGPESKYEGIYIDKGGDPNDDDGKMTYVKASNFTEQARYYAQKIYKSGEDGEKVDTWEYIGWSLVYVMFVVLTLAFVWLYAKRTIYMAALTMFAPIVGVMYPINKANGSRAHSLNTLFKEYMGNLAMQPLHLFSWTVFIGSAMNMAVRNPIYAIIAITGMIALTKLTQELIGIQDTRIGGLGQAMKETTRAIKTTERAATSVARTVGRVAAKGYHKVADTLQEAKDEEKEQESKPPREQKNPQPLSEGEQPAEVLSGEVEPRQTPMGLEDKEAEGLGRGRNRHKYGEDDYIDVPYVELDSEPLQPSPFGESDPLVAGKRPLAIGMNDNAIEGKGAIDEKRVRSLLNDKQQLEEAIKEEEANGLGNGYVAQGYRRDLEKVNQELDSIGYNRGIDTNELGVGGNLVDPLGSPSALGVGATLGNNEIDFNANGIEDTVANAISTGIASGIEATTATAIGAGVASGISQELDEQATLENYMNAGYGKNANGVYFNPYTDEYDEAYSPLNDDLFKRYSSTGIGSGRNSSTVLDDTTMSMIDNLNNNDTGRANEEFVRTNGNVNVYRDRDNGTLRVEPMNIPTGENPMAMAAGLENNSSRSVGSAGTVRTVQDTSTTVNSGDTSNRGEVTVNNPRTVSYNDQIPSQSIPDGVVLETRRSTTSSSNKDNFTVVEGGDDGTGTRLNRSDVSVVNSGTRVINNEVINNAQTNSGSSIPASSSNYTQTDRSSTIETSRSTNATVSGSNSAPASSNTTVSSSSNNAPASNGSTVTSSGGNAPTIDVPSQSRTTRAKTRSENVSGGGETVSSIDAAPSAGATITGAETNKRTRKNEKATNQSNGNNVEAGNNQEAGNTIGTGSAEARTNTRKRKNEKATNQSNGVSEGTSSNTSSETNSGSPSSNTNSGSNTGASSSRTGTNTRTRRNEQTNNQSNGTNAEAENATNSEDNRGTSTNTDSRTNSGTRNDANSGNNTRANNTGTEVSTVVEDNRNDLQLNNARTNRQSNGTSVVTPINTDSGTNSGTVYDTNSANDAGGNNGGAGTSEGTQVSTVTENNESNFQRNNIGTYKEEHRSIRKGIGEDMEKVANVAGKVGGKAGGIIGTAVEGVIDTALGLANGDIGGAANTVLGSTTDILSQTLTGQKRASGQKSNGSKNEKEQEEKGSKPNQNVQTIMKESGMSQAEAKQFEDVCKAKGIQNDLNMGLIAKAYKKVSTADKPYIIELSSVIFQMKRNGQNYKDVQKYLESIGKVSRPTIEVLMKTFKDLHI